MIYEGNNGGDWKNKNGWLPTSGDLFAFPNWYGVETNSDGRVSRLNLGYNNLSGEIVNAFESLKGLEGLDLSYNSQLTGELSQRLMDLSSLTELNIRCTMITMSTDVDFQAWLQTITFTDIQSNDSCSAPPPMQVTRVDVTPGVQRLSVSWNAVADADGYKVQWKSGSQEFDSAREDTVTGGSTTSHTITGLTAGTEYTVRVIATRLDADDALPSSEVKGIPEALDQVVPIDTFADESWVGCAIAPNAGAGEISQGIVFNLILVMSALLVVPWMNYSGAKKT